MTTDPQAPAALRPPTRPGGNWSWILLACPHCGEQHIHGAPRGAQDNGGHRIAHCRDRDRPTGYYVVPATQPTPEDAA
ncbi:hypothetical protein ACSDR0_04505 [Streptosporangium sp. G11]|uniref:hypothetical protein n=1 Tax=Streptosporangium sp. G11 TaxID=3436926 RepID=UPI003EBCDF07